ncbi:MAG: hypothetical protein IJK89_10010 [Clostridia bacterium]|nr:hypothetical protein [Clostridia bacterium]
MKSINIKTLALITGVLFVLMLALRFYQLTALTDPATGFFTDHANVTVILFYVLAVGSAVGIVLLAYLASGMGVGKTEDARSLPLGITSALFAAPLAMESVSGFRALFANLSSYYGFKDAVSAMGGYISVVAPAFALLASVAMLLNGVSFLTGKPIIRKLKLLLLCPTLWAFFKTIAYFKITASYVKVSQLMMTIFADAFLMLFLFEYARFISGIGIKDSVHAFYGTGFVAAFLLLATELPNLYFTLFAREKLIVNCDFGLYNLLAALFVLAALLYAAKHAVPETADEEPAE